MIKKDTHIVIKRDWIEKHLVSWQVRDFYKMLDTIASNVSKHSYYVVNKNEPYADKVLEVILQGEAEKEQK